MHGRVECLCRDRKDPGKKQQIQLKAHPKLSLSGEAMYRYAPRYATGVGLDLFYSSNMEELEKSDRIVYGDKAVENSPGYSALSVGISVVQEVYWHNLAVHVAIGAYPYRHKGVNGPEAKALGDRERGWHYEKAGLRYYFPQLGDTFVGFAIKSHSIKNLLSIIMKRIMTLIVMSLSLSVLVQERVAD